VLGQVQEHYHLHRLMVVRGQVRVVDWLVVAQQGVVLV
jgi:hypothetical protein